MAEPGLLRVCDALARRYGRRPSEFLRSDPFDLAFDLSAFEQGRADDDTIARAAKAWPVVVVNG